MTTITQLPVEATHQVGDFVTIAPDYARADDHGKYYRVAKVPQGARGVNYTLDQIGSTVKVKAPGYMLVPYTGDKAALAATEAATPEAYLGSLVRMVVGGVKGKPADTLYVVTKVGAGTVNIAPLGGDGNRYLRSVPLAHLSVVDPADVLA